MTRSERTRPRPRWITPTSSSDGGALLRRHTLHGHVGRGEWGAVCVLAARWADPAAFAAVRSAEDMMAAVAEQPSNHSPFYAPVVEPTLAVGIGLWWRRPGRGSRCRDLEAGLAGAPGAAIVRAWVRPWFRPRAST